MPVSMYHDRWNPGINWRTTASIIEWHEAVAMWNDGFDTYDIAQSLHIYEAVIYANLPKWRGKP